MVVLLQIQVAQYEKNEETGVDEAPKNNDGHKHEEGTDDKNERGAAKGRVKNKRQRQRNKRSQFKLVMVNVDQRLQLNLKHLLLSL